MAPPKKEKGKNINMKIPLSRYKEIVKATKIKGVLNPTQACREAAYAWADDVLKSAA